MLKLKRNREKGFTLIELLIVVAIIGIIAAILIPNLLDALQKAKQKRTISDVRNTGTSWMSWLTDQVSAASAGAAKKVYDASTHQTVTYPTLYVYLHPTSTFFYMQEVPQLDGWSNEMAWSQTTNLLHSNALAIYAKCRDNAFGEAIVGGVSPIIPFLATDYNHDIVWADGYMAQYPAGTKR